MMGFGTLTYVLACAILGPAGYIGWLTLTNTVVFRENTKEIDWLRRI